MVNEHRLDNLKNTNSREFTSAFYQFNLEWIFGGCLPGSFPPHQLIVLRFDVILFSFGFQEMRMVDLLVLILFGRKSESSFDAVMAALKAFPLH